MIFVIYKNPFLIQGTLPNSRLFNTYLYTDVNDISKVLPFYIFNKTNCKCHVENHDKNGSTQYVLISQVSKLIVKKLRMNLVNTN